MRDPIAIAMRETGKTRLEVLEIMKQQLSERVADTDPRKVTVLAKLDVAIAHEKQLDERFKADIAKVLYDKYTLENGVEVKGQSISFVQRHMRDEGWKGMQAWKLEDELKRTGFKVSRGRGLRIYHGGVRKLGVTCDVVHVA